MRSRKTRLSLGLILLGVILAAGFFGILERRFAEGGLYPHYASFRSDPMGTSAFYQSLEAMEGFHVSRNTEDLNTLKGIDADTVVLLLGFPRDSFDSLRAPENSAVMEAVNEGARLVIAMNPELVPEMFKADNSAEEDEWLERRKKIRDAKIKGDEKGKSGEPEDTKEEDGRSAAEKKDEVEKAAEEELEKEMEGVLGPLLTTRIGFDLAPLEGFERPDEGWESRPGEGLSEMAIPEELPEWMSQYRLEIKDPSWKVAVMVGEKPVVIERKFGSGSIVIASDSYFVSNESLHLRAYPEFLLWLLGDKDKAIFDETIHGTQKSGGAMTLMRRYRAHGAFLGLFVFLMLWAWRSASALVPGSDDGDRGIVSPGGAVAGKETVSGLVHLLRRSIPPGLLLRQCVDVWRSSHTAAPSPEALKELEVIVSRHRENPKQFGLTEAYGAITRLFRKR